jgi:hypothetical protein
MLKNVAYFTHLLKQDIPLGWVSYTCEFYNYAPRCWVNVFIFQNSFVCKPITFYFLIMSYMGLGCMVFLVSFLND